MAAKNRGCGEPTGGIGHIIPIPSFFILRVSMKQMHCISIELGKGKDILIVRIIKGLRIAEYILISGASIDRISKIYFSKNFEVFFGRSRGGKLRCDVLTNRLKRARYMRGLSNINNVYAEQSKFVRFG